MQSWVRFPWVNNEIVMNVRGLDEQRALITAIRRNDCQRSH